MGWLVCFFLIFLSYSPLQTDRASDLEHCSMSWVQLSVKPSSWALSQDTPKNRANSSTNVPRSWTPEGTNVCYRTKTGEIHSQPGAANSFQRLCHTAVPGSQRKKKKKETHTPTLCFIRLHKPCRRQEPQH